MERICTKCGNILPEGALFCTECGTRYEAIAAAAAAVTEAAEEKEAEALKAAEEARQAEEARLAEEALKAQEAAAAEAAKKAEEARLAEEARQAELARQAEAARQAEEAKRAEAARAAQAKAEAEAKKAQERAAKAQEEVARAQEKASREAQAAAFAAGAAGMDVPGEYATGNAVVERPVKTGAYFWLMLLFAIPVIGLISVIIFSFAPKKQSLKNFARANLIWVIVGLVLTLIAALVGFIVLNSAGVSLQELLSATPEQILEFLQQLFQ